MVNAIVCNKAQAPLTNPLPKDNILIHCMRLQLLLCFQVENLKCALGFQGDNLFAPVHDSTICLDCPPCDLVAIMKVDYYDLCCCLITLFTNADEVIALQGLWITVREWLKTTARSKT